MRFEVPITRFGDEVARRFGVPPRQMVRRFYDAQIDERRRRRATSRAAIRSLSQWEQERRRLRQNVLEAAGPFPPREPTSFRCVGKVEKRDLVMEKLLFLAHRDSWVPANLYLPGEGPGPFPSVVVPPGHDLQGKIAYRRLAAFFARNGYAALTFDFVGEGERVLFARADTPLMVASDQHNVLGMQLGLHGVNLNWFMLYDCLRAVDFLGARPEIAADRLVMTGASGGGTATVYAASLDERIRVMAPCASVHSGNTRSASDYAEQVFWRHFESDLDYPDVAAFLLAPRPLLIVANTDDIWPLDGTKEVFEVARRFCRLHGCEEKIELKIWEGGHDIHAGQPEAVLAWFNRWLSHDHPLIPWDAISDDNIPREQECLVSERGHLYSQGFKTPIAVFRCHFPARRRPARRLPARVRAAVAAPRRPFWTETDRYQVGAALIRRLIEYVRGWIEILPGGGINEFNLEDVIQRTGCTQVHLGLLQPAADRSCAARPHVYFGGVLRPPEDCYETTRTESVRQIRLRLTPTPGRTGRRR